MIRWSGFIHCARWATTIQAWLTRATDLLAGPDSAITLAPSNRRITWAFVADHQQDHVHDFSGDRREGARPKARNRVESLLRE